MKKIALVLVVAFWVLPVHAVRLSISDPVAGTGRIVASNTPFAVNSFTSHIFSPYTMGFTITSNNPGSLFGARPGTTSEPYPWLTFGATVQTRDIGADLTISASEFHLTFPSVVGPAYIGVELKASGFKDPDGFDADFIYNSSNTSNIISTSHTFTADAIAGIPPIFSTTVFSAKIPIINPQDSPNNRFQLEQIFRAKVSPNQNVNFFGRMFVMSGAIPEPNILLLIGLGSILTCIFQLRNRFT